MLLLVLTLLALAIPTLGKRLNLKQAIRTAFQVFRLALFAATLLLLMRAIMMKDANQIAESLASLTIQTATFWLDWRDRKRK